MIKKIGILIILIYINTNIFAISEVDTYITSQLVSYDKANIQRTDYDFFDRPSIIVWGTNSDDDDEIEVNEMMAEDIVAFRINRWLDQSGSVEKIIPDTLLSIDDIKQFNLILVGTLESNKITQKISRYLPIEFSSDGITYKNWNFEGDEVGVMLRYINPINPANLVWIISSPSYESLRFIPKAVDYCIFEVTDYSLNADRIKELAQGNFSNYWSLEDLNIIDNEEIDTGENDSFDVTEIKDYPFPKWAETGVMYEVFVRSFYDSDGDGIGDLKGLTEKLDYLNDGDPETDSDLGVKLLWLMPIFESPSYHCYDVSDYTKIEPDYGTNEDFQYLLKEAHKRGIKIITDLVLNHCSSQHPYFQDAYENPDSQYDDWFFFTNESNSRAHNWQFRHREKDRALLEPFMPAWNVNNIAVQEYLFDIARYWMDPDQDGDFSDGIDGFRCDYVKGPPPEFWQNFRQSVKALNSDVLLLAENWEGLTSIAQSFDHQFDMAFDFPFQGSLAGSISSGTSRELINILTEQQRILPEHAVMNRFFNNHDMNRIFTQLDEKSAKLGLTILLTMNNMPMLYYGDEIGMKGSKNPYDEGIRRPMEWCADNDCEGMTNWYPVWQSGVDGISVEEEQKDPQSILNYVKNLIKIRESNSTFSSGEIEFLDLYRFNSVEGGDLYKRAIGYILSSEEGKFLVLCNLHDAENLMLQTGSAKNIIIDEIILSSNHKVAYDADRLVIRCPLKSSFIAKLVN